MNPYVTDVHAQENFTLNLTFTTGERRRFDVTPYLSIGVFQRLRERSVFKAARVVAGSVEWPGEIDLSYDTLYLEGNENFVDVVFDPWVGSRYRCGGRFGVRLLVLDESHYGKRDEIRTTLTSDVVQTWGQTKRMQFFTIVSKVLLGLDQNVPLDDSSRSSIWEDVAFYSYVQVLLDGPRERPTDEMWASAGRPFLGVLKELEPDAILVLGNELNDRLPTNLLGQVQNAHIPHPTSPPFSYQAANPVFTQLIERARFK